MIGILVFVLLFSAYIPTFALGLYGAGDTLNPNCSPGYVDENGNTCTVRVMSTPSVDGTAGQILSTDGSGVLSWISAGSGSQTPWTSAINAAGYTLNGNSTASGNLTLDSTSHATKGYVLINPTGGNVGIGVASPTATLHLKAGTATASTAPLKFTSGTLLTIPEAGAVEFLTDAYYGTITTGGVRKQFAFIDIATLSSLSSVGTITTGTWSGLFGAVSGANLTSLTAANLSGTIPSAVLGNSTVYIGTTAVALNRASSALVLTGITSIDGNAATVTTNANLTGSITSVGNATSVASQTGTGSTFVMDTSPTLVTPVLGVASATTINKVTITTPATGSTLTIADGKVLTVNNTISFASADDTGIYTLPTGTKTLVATDIATLSSLSSVGTITTGTWSGLFGAVSGANLTSLTAANLSGTIPSAVLGNSTVYIGTTAVALNRASAALVLTGITSIDGNAATATSATSATTATTATNIAGGAGGQIVYQSAAGTTALLANGTAGQVLQSNGTTLAPSWVAAGGGSQTPWTSAINAAGYTLNGNSTASGNLTLDSTSHATKGYVLINPTGGNVGIGVASPTATLHLKAGTATASTAPLKFTSGTLLTTPEAGAIEFLTDAYYGTITTGGVRKQFAFIDIATLSSLSSVGTITTGTWSGSFGAVSGANLTSLTAANLSGTIPSAVLGNSTVYIGTTAVALNRASAALVLTGITSIDGNAATATSATSATTATTATNIAGGAGGQIVYQSAAGTTALLANGTAGQVLQSNGTTLAPSWVAAGGGSQTPWTAAINAAGYTLNGNSTVSGNLTLDSTSNVTKGYVLINPTGGNVGVGIATPGAYGNVEFQQPLGTGTGPYNLGVVDTTTQSIGHGGGITFGGAYTGTTLTTAANIRAEKTNSTAGDYSFGLGFYTRNNGSPTAENMVINNLGNVGIGIANPTYKLQVNGQPGANGYTAFTNYSDARLKENVTDLIVDNSSALDKINLLRPVTYNYNSLTGYDEATRSRRISGFIAQELQIVFPGMVGETTINGQSYLDTNLSDLPLYMVKAIQELNLKINDLSVNTDITPLSNSGNEIFVGEFFNNVFAKTKVWFADVGNGIGDLFANRIHTKELCVSDDSGETCITRTKLNTLLSQNGGNNSSNTNSSSSETQNIFNTSPVITLNGNSLVNLNIGDIYTEEGATVIDDVDTELEIIISGSVDTAIVGNYDITYSATDSNSNTTNITRTVVVSERIVVIEPVPDPVIEPIPEPVVEPAPVDVVPPIQESPAPEIVPAP